MWKCQIFLRLSGKNAVARVAAQAAVYSLSYCYGAFYTIVLFRQLVNAIQARASFESVLGLLAVFCAMGVANTLLKGWYEHRFVPRSDCALEQALAASVYQKAASADLACFEDSDYYDRMGRAAATARESALAALDAMSDLLATACILVANALYVVWVDGTLLPLIALPAALALHWQRKKGALEGRMEEACEPYRRRTAYARRVLLLKEYAQEIRLTGAGKIAAARFREGCAGLMRVARERGWRIALYEIGAEFLLRVVLYAGLYGYAAWRYLACAAFTLGDFAAISGAINNVVWFVEKSGEHIATLRKQAHAAGQLDAFMREEIRVRGGSEPCAFQNEIALKDIRFSYPGAKRAALTGVSLTLHRGESIALVGENGAGKTTLVSCFCGCTIQRRARFSWMEGPIAPTSSIPARAIRRGVSGFAPVSLQRFRKCACGPRRKRRSRARSAESRGACGARAIARGYAGIRRGRLEPLRRPGAAPVCGAGFCLRRAHRNFG